MTKHTLLACALFASLSGSAQSQVYAYSMSEFGRVFLNGSQIIKLPSDLDPNDEEPHWRERWMDQAVMGAAETGAPATSPAA